MKTIIKLILLLLIPASVFAHDVTVTWTPSTTANVSYIVIRGTSSGAETLTVTPSPVAANCAGASCTFDDTLSLVEGTVYYYVVEAVSTSDTTNISLPSVEAVANAIPKTKPAAPSGVKAGAK